MITTTKKAGRPFKKGDPRKAKQFSLYKTDIDILDNISSETKETHSEIMRRFIRTSDGIGIMNSPLKLLGHAMKLLTSGSDS